MSSNAVACVPVKSSGAPVPAVVLPLKVPVETLASFAFVTTPVSIVQVAPVPLTVISPLSPSVTPPPPLPPGRLVNPEPSPINAVAFTVPTTSNFCVGIVVPTPTLPEVKYVLYVLVPGPTDQGLIAITVVAMPTDDLS